MSKHLNLSQRIEIESELNKGTSFRSIANIIGKPHTTVSYEVENRRVFIKGNGFNMTNMNCKKLNCAPFVCNSCPNKKKCHKNKYLYYAKDAQDNYHTTLVESRTGIDFETDEFRTMDKIIKEETDKGHSFYMIVQDHPEFNITERTLYLYQEKGYLSTKNIDMPRKVRYKKRKRKVAKNKSQRKEDQCRNGRTFIDFNNYCDKNNIKYYVQMDTVEGEKGSSCLLTLCIIPFDFLLAYKIKEQTISEITSKIKQLKRNLGTLGFHQVFPILLTDNGKEFKRPDLIEDNGPDIQESKVFYCDPKRSDQKGTIEVTHEYIRRYIEQGQSFDNYSQEQINLMISHINNVRRKELNNKTPYELFEEKFGLETLKKLEISKIPPEDIILNSNLFKDNQ